MADTTQKTTPTKAPRPGDASELAAGYTSSHRRVEISAIVLFLAVSVYWAYRLIAAVDVSESTASLWTLIGALVASWLAADFVSGFVHWAADNWGSPDWPIIGESLIRPFRHHHVAPAAMCEHDFVELNGNSCIVSLPVLAGAALLPVGGSLVALGASTFLGGLCLWVFGTNQFHAWAHEPNPPAWLRALQKSGLILSPEHHAVHHALPHDRHYCITCGWMNHLLDGLGFFVGLERLITALSGVEPAHGDLGDEEPVSAPSSH